MVTNGNSIQKNLQWGCPIKTLQGTQTI